MDEKLYTKALQYLSKRPRSEKEVQDYLEGKKKKYYPPHKRFHFTPEQQEAYKIELHEKTQVVMDKLREQHFVDDLSFARFWIEQRLRFRPKGWRLLLLELSQKGIDKELAEEARKSLEDTSLPGEKEAANQLVLKHIKKYQGLSRQELYVKLGGFLARRGFDLDTIRACIDEVVEKSV